MSLFGNTNVSNLDFAKLTPQQQSSYLIAQNTQKAAQGIQGLFGVETPQV